MWVSIQASYSASVTCSRRSYVEAREVTMWPVSMMARSERAATLSSRCASM